MTTLVNLTPHEITLRGEAGDTVVPPSGVVARVASTPGALETIPGIPVPVARPQVFGAIEGLPAWPRKDVVYIVSGVVLAALKGTRDDVFGPGTGPNDNACRNEKGQVIAVTRLVRG